MELKHWWKAEKQLKNNQNKNLWWNPVKEWFGINMLALKAIADFWKQFLTEYQEGKEPKNLDYIKWCKKGVQVS